MVILRMMMMVWWSWLWQWWWWPISWWSDWAVHHHHRHPLPSSTPLVLPIQPGEQHQHQHQPIQLGDQQKHQKLLSTLDTAVHCLDLFRVLEDDFCETQHFTDRKLRSLFLVVCPASVTSPFSPQYIAIPPPLYPPPLLNHFKTRLRSPALSSPYCTLTLSLHYTAT